MRAVGYTHNFSVGIGRQEHPTDAKLNQQMLEPRIYHVENTERLLIHSHIPIMLSYKLASADSTRSKKIHIYKTRQ